MMYLIGFACLCVLALLLHLWYEQGCDDVPTGSMDMRPHIPLWFIDRHELRQAQACIDAALAKHFIDPTTGMPKGSQWESMYVE